MASNREQEEEHPRRLSHRDSLSAAANEALPPPVHFESHRITDDHLSSLKNKKVREFYEVRLFRKQTHKHRHLFVFTCPLASKCHDWTFH
jgi:hypothetical protein